MWSSSTALNNTASKQRGTTKPFREVKDVQRPNEISHAFQSILAMPEYNNKSVIELRWEDYQDGRLPGQNPTGGMFGGTQNTGSFGTTPSAFGQPAQPVLNSGFAFGAQPQSTSMFGQPTATPAATGGLFGQPAPATGGGLFGQSTVATTGGGLFGQPAPAATSGLFGQPAAAPATGGGLFGQPAAAPATGGGLFGQQAAATNTGGGLFGAKPATGGGLFGQQAAAPATGGGLFGQPAPAPVSGGGLFGQPAPAPVSGGGLFGQQAAAPATGGGLFGQQAAAPATGGGLFGANRGLLGQQAAAPATGGGLFGQQAAAPATGGGLFGQPAPAATGGGLFGQQAAAPATGGGLFGQPAAAPATGGGLFGAKPATGGGLFGQPAPTATTGGGLFGSSTAAPATGGGLLSNSGGGLFGSSTAPSTSGGLFGSSSSTGITSSTTGGGGLFGSASTSTGGGLTGGATGGGLFGSSTAAPATGGGLFGSSGAAGGGGLFGSSSATGGTTGGGLFGNISNLGSVNNANPQQGFAVQGVVASPPTVQPPSDPYGLGVLLGPSSNLSSNTVAAVSGVLDQVKATPPVGFAGRGGLSSAGMASSSLWRPLADTVTNPLSGNTISSNALRVNHTPSESALLLSTRVTPVSARRNTSTSQVNSAFAPPPVPTSQLSPLTAALTPSRSSTSAPANSTPSTQQVTMGSLTPQGLYGSSTKKLDLAEVSVAASSRPLIGGSLAVLMHNNAPGGKTSSVMTPAALRIKNALTPLAETRTPSSHMDGSSGQRANVYPSLATPHAIGSQSGFHGAPPSAVPKLTKPGYYTKPSVEALKHMTEQELSRVLDFEVGCYNVGRVVWEGSSDIRGVDLDAVVELTQGSVRVYNDEFCPPVGTQLNKTAIIELRAPPVDMSKIPSDPAELEAYKQKRRNRLMKESEKQGAVFLEYDTSNWTWKFRVFHFSRYACLLDDDEGEDAMAPGTHYHPPPPNVVFPTSAESEISLMLGASSSSNNNNYMNKENVNFNSKATFKQPSYDFPAVIHAQNNINNSINVDHKDNHLTKTVFLPAAPLPPCELLHDSATLPPWVLRFSRAKSIGSSFFEGGVVHEHNLKMETMKAICARRGIPFDSFSSNLLDEEDEENIAAHASAARLRLRAYLHDITVAIRNATNIIVPEATASCLPPVLMPPSSIELLSFAIHKIAEISMDRYNAIAATIRAPANRPLGFISTSQPRAHLPPSMLSSLVELETARDHAETWQLMRAIWSNGALIDTLALSNPSSTNPREILLQRRARAKVEHAALEWLKKVNTAAVIRYLTGTLTGDSDEIAPSLQLTKNSINQQFSNVAASGHLVADEIAMRHESALMFLSAGQTSIAADILAAPMANLHGALESSGRMTRSAMLLLAASSSLPSTEEFDATSDFVRAISSDETPLGVKKLALCSRAVFALYSLLAKFDDAGHIDSKDWRMALALVWLYADLLPRSEEEEASLDSVDRLDTANPELFAGETTPLREALRRFGFSCKQGAPVIEYRLEQPLNDTTQGLSMETLDMAMTGSFVSDSRPIPIPTPIHLRRDKTSNRRMIDYVNDAPSASTPLDVQFAILRLLSGEISGASLLFADSAASSCVPGDAQLGAPLSFIWASIIGLAHAKQAKKDGNDNNSHNTGMDTEENVSNLSSSVNDKYPLINAVSVASACVSASLVAQELHEQAQTLSLPLVSTFWSAASASFNTLSLFADDDETVNKGALAGIFSDPQSEIFHSAVEETRNASLGHLKFAVQHALVSASESMSTIANSDDDCSIDASIELDSNSTSVSSIRRVLHSSLGIGVSLLDECEATALLAKNDVYSLLQATRLFMSSGCVQEAITALQRCENDAIEPVLSAAVDVLEAVAFVLLGNGNEGDIAALNFVGFAVKAFQDVNHTPTIRELFSQAKLVVDGGKGDPQNLWSSYGGDLWTFLLELIDKINDLVFANKLSRQALLDVLLQNSKGVLLLVRADAKSFGLLLKSRLAIVLRRLSEVSGGFRPFVMQSRHHNNVSAAVPMILN